ncbi:hypothetical protein C5E45_14320 [Nocardia nova]|uniref:HTH-like domain-containing protein n=1 Tax=Nocardia nova TaxID=37330 RepID=A0A2S6ARB5_9NOCA|nr:IS3 family transposase [Nocardia nova]PPJ27459.1 hypothetical protein C5E41_16235 [Nocardia nova]PPJ37801.1 hypothetical protein C5E45_14320 [Nocardia nova]
MAEYAGPDTVTGVAGTEQPAGHRFSIRRMARLLQVSKSGYYAYVKRRAATVLTDRQQRRADLETKIVTVHRESHGTYGSPRITGELRDRGERVSAKTVAKIMASAGLEGISPRTFKVRTTVADPAASFPPDLVERRFDRGRPDAVWTTDITYLTCGEGDMFLCAIRDGHTRKVLAYTLADHIGADMVTDAIAHLQDVHRTSQIHKQQQTATSNTDQQPRTRRSRRFAGQNQPVISSIEECDRSGRVPSRSGW